MPVRLARFDDVPPRAPRDPESISRRTAQLVADLVEPTNAEALDKLGECRQALEIATRWVRGKLTQVAAGADESVAKAQL
jgi:hypothetical protein